MPQVIKGRSQSHKKFEFELWAVGSTECKWGILMEAALLRPSMLILSLALGCTLPLAFISFNKTELSFEGIWWAFRNF